ncbi:hypothetical protein PAXRUDRAFT_827208 [Paxillus rubicundulus Ve08.2h10]|uniref:Uncharacterized protein n=1 Tax=Paxillus rubicundulus Ve08.2h10 TaxID=930991 RepID=A0A0D0E346_9AGAM|nr:hypothetical protein PAXRUDRAFT_827208 [Paxillus rubicundulus Ve08.2h10]
MEVDMHSPPSTFRAPMGYTVKRPRSPGSPTQERQAKRLSLAVGEGSFNRRSPMVSDVVTGGSRLPKHDDWVRQARELTIGSPLGVGFPPVMDVGGTQSRVDEHMAVDHEDALRPCIQLSMSRHLQSSRSHLPSIHITTTPSSIYAPQPSPAPFSVLTEPPSSSTASSPSSSLPVTGAHPPDIFLFPATPSDTSSHQRQFGSSEFEHTNVDIQTYNHSQDQIHTRGRIEGSSCPGKTTDAPSSSNTNKKHRVTMGPRADCIKCRMGIKGHWMHFD